MVSDLHSLDSEDSVEEVHSLEFGFQLVVGSLSGTSYGRKPDAAPAQADSAGRRLRFALEETGFDEVPRKYRRFYRRWEGEADSLAPNEVLCPVCKVVIRSTRELRPGDRVYCMPCMSRLVVVEGSGGRLEARVTY